jgi:TPR repeat protein
MPADIALAPTYESSDAERSHAAGLAALRTRDFVTAVREFRSAALAGYAPSQATVGYLYLNGLGGLPKDEAEAARWFAPAGLVVNTVNAMTVAMCQSLRG